MRLSHLTLIILVAAVILALSRDLLGRIILVMLLTGGGLATLATLALLQLFQTIGALGAARDPGAHIRAAGATLVVLLLASGGSMALVASGIFLLRAVLR